jgi:CubicO group peptidase (beta-lactamase class C family)
MLTNQLSEGVNTSAIPPMPEKFQFGLGLALETEKNDFVSPLTIGSFSWEGAFCTYFWVDPKENLIALFYTQEYASPYWTLLKDQFKVMVYQALEK